MTILRRIIKKREEKKASVHFCLCFRLVLAGRRSQLLFVRLYGQHALLTLKSLSLLSRHTSTTQTSKLPDVIVVISI